ELLRTTVDLEGHVVARLLRRDDIAQPLDRPHGGAVGLDDHVAAEPVALAREDDVRRPGLEPRLRSAAARLDALDEQAGRDREAEDARQLRRDPAGADPDERVLDLAVLDDLRDDALDGVARDGEADA